MIDLGTLFRDGASESRGYGINDSGTVTGFTDVDPYGYAHAFVTVGDQMIDLGAFDESDYSYSVGYAINDGAQVTGESRHCISASCGRTLAFLTDPDDGHMIDLGTLEGDVASVGNAINNRGQVAGSSSNNASISHAFVTALTDRHLIDLGNPWVDDFPSCSGQGIDDNGQVVGYCQTDTYPYVYRAFLWDEINGMRDLNTLVPGLATAGWDHLEAAYGISHTAGYITGMGITVADGRHHAFLLVPPPQEYQVEGQILNAFGLPVVGVAIQIGGTIQATTAADGSYSLTLDAGQHTLTPVLAGYLFTPPELTVNGPPDDAQADFLAQLAGDLDGDGCVGRNDVTILLGAVRSGSTDPTTEDVNGDGLVNRADGRALMQLYTNADGACPAFD
jgi:probable HAF family extracellular repeat protein